MLLVINKSRFLTKLLPCQYFHPRHLHQAITRAKKAAGPAELRKAIGEVFQLVEEAWGMPTLGRDVAKVLCDVIRLEGGLDPLLNLLHTAELETKCQAGKLLEQILVAENR